MPADRFTIHTGDGRAVEALVCGPPGGFPLVLHNGTPGGLVTLASMTRAAEERGLRTVMCARPGYGGSTPLPGRSVADVAGDVAAVLDELGAGPFVTAGWSGGGPHALACAAILPGRCLAAATLAGVAPYQAEGLDWLTGMGPENRAEFAAAAAGPAKLTAFLDAAARTMREISGPEVATALGGLVSEADRAVLTGDFADYLAASFRAALSGGVAGWRDDDLAFVRDWGFPVASAGAAPASVWQGDLDRMVPRGHGAWLAGHVPGARAHMLDGEGHLSLTVSVFGSVLDELLELSGRSPAPGPSG